MKYYKSLCQSIISTPNPTKKHIVLAYLLSHNAYEPGNTWLLDNGPFQALTYTPEGHLVLYSFPNKDDHLTKDVFDVKAQIKIIK